MSPKRRSFLLLIFTSLSFTAFAYKNFGGELSSALNKRKTALQHDWSCATQKTARNYT